MAIFTMCPFCGERIETEKYGETWAIWPDCKCGAWPQGDIREGEVVWKSDSRTSIIHEENEVEA